MANFEFDIDTSTPVEPEPPMETPRKGRRSRNVATEQDVDDAVQDRVSVTKPNSAEKVVPNIATIDEIGISEMNKPKKTGWNNIVDGPKKERKSRKSVTDVDDKKGTVIGRDSEEVMVVIPDLM
jgi:hypothetical protein